MNTHEVFDESFQDKIKEACEADISTKDAEAAMKNLEIFSRCRPPMPELDPEPIPEPETFWGKVKVGAKTGWDNETTRILIKAGGAFAGVALVAYTTIHKDHVVERQAMSQANQRNS